MKIALMSDVHLEFGDLPIEPVDAEILLLAGDIMVAADLTIQNDRRRALVNFMEDASNKFHSVIYIAGNHEHYHGDFATTYGILKANFKDFSNVHVLDKESIEIEGVTFIGGTLWTDMNKEDPETIYAIKRYMNDFNLVKDSSMGGTKKFTPEASIVDHKLMVDYIRSVAVDPNRKYVVVGHHAPSKLSTHPTYKDDVLTNGGYSSDLSDLILDHPQIKLWVHGHTHHEFDYVIGETRIVCNPRGYLGHERSSHRLQPYYAKVMEI